MPSPYPPEFRLRALEQVRHGEKTLQQVADDLRISKSCLQRWVHQDATDNGEKSGVTTAEKKELTELRKRVRILEMEQEILKRAAALFARENVLPK